MKAIVAAALITVLTHATFVRAQSSSPAQSPASAQMHEQQGYFVGYWTLSGETKASPFGPGGKKFLATEKLEWLPGEFFLVAHSYDKNKLAGLTIIAYDQNANVFTHTTYSASGEVEVMKGTAQGDTVIWSTDGKVHGQAVKERMTIKKVSPVLYTFKFEIAPASGDWSVVYEGKGVKTS